MTPRFAFPALLRRGLAAAVLVALAPPARGQAPDTWTVDPEASLAWWQVNPHLNHLWATSCPQDPSWRPGEGRSGGWTIEKGLETPEQGYAAVSDTSKVPLYPRAKALRVCNEAVHGTIVVPDTATWRGVHGEITVKASVLVTGHKQRDAHAQLNILESHKYPLIRFRIDSLLDVKRHGDTLSGTAAGVFQLRQVARPMMATVQAWPEADGLRTTARFKIDAMDLVTKWGLSRRAFGLGVVTKIWHHLFMGVDVVLRPANPSSGN